MSQSSGFSYAFNPNRNQYIEQEQDDDGQGGGEDVSNVQDQHEQFQFEQEDEDGRQYQYGDGGDQASFEEEAQMKRNYDNTYAEFENDEDATTKSMVQAANQQHSSYGHGYGDELKTRPGQEMNYLVADESIESVDTQYQTHVHKLLIQRETLLNQLNTEQSIKIELAKELEQVQLLTAQAQREGSLIVAYGTSLRAQLLAGEKNSDFEKKELIVLEAEDEKLAKKVAEHHQRIVNVKKHAQTALDHSRKQFQARQDSIERRVVSNSNWYSDIFTLVYCF